MMTRFELYRPTDVDTALGLLDKLGPGAWKMAGGQDSLDWFKDRAKRPGAVIDMSGIAAMRGIRETAEGVQIGALTTLTDVAEDSLINDRYRAMSARIRAAGTTATASTAIGRAARPAMPIPRRA